MKTDARGCAVSTRSQAAVDHLERAYWRLASFYGTPLEDLDAASAADPQWMLPHVVRAGFLLSITEHKLLPDAHAALTKAEALAAGANERERAQLAAAHRCFGGDWHGACAAWEALLTQHPRDLLALQMAHLFDFYRGDARNLRQRVARVLPEWDRSDVLYPYVLGMYAFGLEESNLYPLAEQVGREAAGGSACVPWAVHAVAHVMEMQGRHEEGRAWLNTRRSCWAEDDNGLAGHNWWHLALFHLETLDFAGALQIFDEQIATQAAVDVTLQRLDATALLWRLHLLGAEAGAERWATNAAAWQQDAAAAGFYAFNDLHALLAFVGSGQLARAEALLAEVTARAERSEGANKAMAREVGLPLMRGLLAFAQGRYDEAIGLLQPVRSMAHHFGGSHAQRDLIDQTLLAAAARSAHHKGLGRALLNERRLAKPSTPLTQHWAAQLH
jgi:hypothetical protein